MTNPYAEQIEVLEEEIRAIKAQHDATLEERYDVLNNLHDEQNAYLLKYHQDKRPNEIINVGDKLQVTELAKESFNQTGFEYAHRTISVDSMVITESEVTHILKNGSGWVTGRNHELVWPMRQAYLESIKATE